MIDNAIKRAFEKAKKKKWNCTYWLIDVHETILVPNYSLEISGEFYPRAERVLQILSGRPDIILIMYTCSWPKEIEKYLTFFEEHGIHFSYVNKNPEVIDQGYGYYQDKPYADVLVDDKAGFDQATDWDKILFELAGHPILKG